MHRHNTAVLQVPYLKDETFKAAREGASTNLTTLEKLLFPYVKTAEGKRDVKNLREMYVATFGDWQTDPVAKANLDRLVAHLQKRADEGARALARMQPRYARKAT